VERLARYDVGPKINPVTPGSEELAGQVEQVVEAQLAMQGTDVYGRTVIEVVWQAGQIKAFDHGLRQRVTSDKQ